MDDFRISIDVPVDLAPQHAVGLEKAVHQCLIHNTLLHPPALSIDIKTAASEDAVRS